MNVSEHLIDGMTIDTIIRLVRLVLENQYFIHNYKLYRQIAGSASGSMLTIPLVYIYLFYWQRNLMDPFINKNELFGRQVSFFFLNNLIIQNDYV